ncbi:nucleoside hydrolase [Paenibacillus cremeus]|uniref:Nucleoside hydrolase n=1 Tax=Paenibacillus cremeus TaxID=2163881 RepID=A0A559KI27_9BACL|nr:nucleoside hydrolase [Paenibacillus cremeus]TVY11790.1 nucleoside hydrolase [Paenibacillus cremeus]
MSRKKVLLDTDIGGDIDDALCLAYLLCQPACELVGITTVGGEVEKRAMVADAICRAAGRSIPVYAGADRQLLPSPLYPKPAGAARLSGWEHEAAFAKYQAADFMRRTIREHPHEISLLAVGHLTNIATLFLVDPEIPSLIKELNIMSGVFSEELEAELEMPMANWNAWLDPHACAIVYNADVPLIRTFGLNVTTKLVLRKEQADGWFETRLMKAVEDFGSPWLAKHDMTLHDPLAAACLFEPQLCEYQGGTVEVELMDERRLGSMTFHPSSGGRCEIAMAVNRDAFFEHYYAMVSGGKDEGSRG